MTNRILTREQLRLRRPKSVSHTVFPQRGGIAIHWGGDPQHLGAHVGCEARWREWQAFHMDGRGWSDIAYNWGVCDHGYVLTGRGSGVRSAANGTNDANDRYLAVVWLGGEGDGPPTPEALNSFDFIIAAARRQGAGDDVQPHGHFYQTDCPGPVLTRWCPRWAGSEPVPAFPLAKGKWFGPGGVLRSDLLRPWQERMRIGVDGTYGTQTAATARGLQQAHGLREDGLIGAITWRAAW